MSTEARPTFILCRAGMSDTLVQQIWNTVPETWSVVETEDSVRANQYGGNILFVLSGKDGSLRLRFTGGSAVGAFSIKVRELPSLFSKIIAST